MKKKNRKTKGTSLLEMFVAVTIFSIAVFSIFSLYEYGTRNWKSMDEKNRIQTDIRKVFMFLTKDIQNSTFGRFEGSAISGIKVYTTNYTHAICLQSAIDDNNYFIINEDKKPVCQKYILYYIIRPPESFEWKDTGLEGNWQDPGYGHNICLSKGTPQNPDNICPHKWLIRKELSTNIADESQIASYINLSLKKEGNCMNAKLLSSYILTFNINDQQKEGYIDITLKSLRLFEYTTQISKSIQENTIDSLQKESIQIDGKIIPDN